MIEDYILEIIEMYPGISGTSLELRVMERFGTRFNLSEYQVHITYLKDIGKIYFLIVTPLTKKTTLLYFKAGTKFEFVMR